MAPATLSNLHDEARERYAQRIPPGFADEKEKGEPGAFGDYIGWKQILDFATSEKCNVLLVTDDSKEDWWQITDARTIGPHPELMSEFTKTCQRSVYLYSSSSFVTRSSDHLDIELNDEVVAELRAATEARIADENSRKDEPKAETEEAPKKAATRPTGESPKAENLEERGDS